MSDQYLPKLFNENVVWDSTKFGIVQNMTSSECLAVAKWTAWQLRTSSPQMNDAFRQLPQMYEVLAGCSLINLQRSLDETLEDAENSDRLIRLNDRRCDSVEKKMITALDLIDNYRRASGYRGYSLLALAAGDGNSPAIVSAAKGMLLLNKAQYDHFEIMRITENLKQYLKIDVSTRTEALGTEIDLQFMLLDSHMSKLDKVFNSIEFMVEGRSLQDYRNDLLARCPQVTDVALDTINRASCTLQTFRATNKALVQLLTGKINQLTETRYPEARVFPEAA